MGEVYFNRAGRRTQPQKNGYGFQEAVVEGVASRAAPLVEILEAAHQHGGNPGYPALAMLSAYVMQFTLREPYANGFLDKLGGNERFLDICRLPHAPSEGAYSRFKKKLADHVDLIQRIIADVFLECGVEIERLREAGIVPADQPPLGESLVMDSTDSEAWARPGRKSRKTGEQKPSKDLDASGATGPLKTCARQSRVQGNAVRAEVPRKAPVQAPSLAERRTRMSCTLATRSTSSPTLTMDCRCSA